MRLPVPAKMALHSAGANWRHAGLADAALAGASIPCAWMMWIFTSMRRAVHARDLDYS